MTRTITLCVLLLCLVSNLTSNALNAQCWGGNIRTGDAMQEAYVCPGNGASDNVFFQNTGSENANYAYAVTDINNNIMFVIDNWYYDFETIALGEYYIWGFSYTGDLTYQVGDFVHSTQFASGCWMISSTRIDLHATSVDGGSISNSLGDNPIYVCLNDGIPDWVSFSNNSSTNAQYAYIVTNENNIIIDVLDGNYGDFNNGYPGLFKVWGVSYTGTLTAYNGQDVTTSNMSDNCFEISSNFVLINKNQTIGGNISTTTSEFHLDLNTGDGIPDVISFMTNSWSSANYVYVIADGNNNIIEIMDGNTYDFEGAPAGTCRIWAFSYTGPITANIGDSVFSTQFSEGCWNISHTAVTIYKENDGTNTMVDGGSVSTDGGVTEVSICAGDGIDDIIDFFNSSTSSSSYAYLVTDSNNNVVSISDGSYNFESSGTGTCFAYGVSYNGALLVNIGDDVNNTTLATEDYELSNNNLVIDKTWVDGAMVGVTGSGSGQTFFSICANDGIPDIYNFTNTTQSAENYTYVIADQNNNIIDFLTGSEYDFEGSGSGTCFAYGLSYTGNIIATPGTSINDPLTDGCYGLSDNLITFDKSGVEGGSIATADGETTFKACPADGMPDIAEFVNDGGSTSAYVYLITTTDNEIVEISTDPFFDFETYDLGMVRVWGLSYNGMLTAMAGMNAATAILADNCYDLSDNFIEVLMAIPDAGDVLIFGQAGTETEACVGDGSADIVLFDNTGQSECPYAYIITDENNIIISDPGGNGFDFDNSGAGICRIWGLSYAGTYTGAIGEDITNIVLSSSCYDLSGNFLTVVKSSVDGGIVAGNGMAELSFCNGDGMPDVVTFTNDGSATASYTYIVTDESLEIVDILLADVMDFEMYGAGAFRVFGVSYNGNLTATVGGSIIDALADDCFALSGNYVSITNADTEGGTISFSDLGLLPVAYVCHSDDQPDIIDFYNNSTSIANYAYILTDFENTILEVEEGTSHDFDGAGEGICRVWGLSYVGNLTAMPGMNAATAMLADGCFELSNNFIEVVRDIPEAGMVTDFIGETALEICYGDALGDFISPIVYGGSQSSTCFVLTDANGMLVTPPFQYFVDLEELALSDSEYRIYAIAFTGEKVIEVGDDIFIEDVTDDCWDISVNYIEITVYMGAEGPCSGAFAMESNNSNTVLSNNLNSITNTVQDLSLSPNPATDMILLDFDATENGYSRVMIVDSNGKLISGFAINKVKGHNQQRIDIADLSAGLYILRMDGSDHSEQVKFVKY